MSAPISTSFSAYKQTLTHPAGPFSDLVPAGSQVFAFSQAQSSHDGVNVSIAEIMTVLRGLYWSLQNLGSSME